MSDFCSSTAGRLLVASSIRERSDGRDLTGKRGLNRARSRSSGAAGAAIAVARKAGRRAERTSGALTSLRAGLSKSGASLFAPDALTALPKAVARRAHDPG